MVNLGTIARLTSFFTRQSLLPKALCCCVVYKFTGDEPLGIYPNSSCKLIGMIQLRRFRYLRQKGCVLPGSVCLSVCLSVCNFA